MGPMGFTRWCPQLLCVARQSWHGTSHHQSISSGLTRLLRFSDLAASKQHGVSSRYLGWRRRCVTTSTSELQRGASSGRYRQYFYGAAVLCVPYVLYESTPQDVRALVVDIPTRLARDVVAALLIIRDYKKTLQLDGNAESKEAALHACHQRSADRLLRLCFKNGGVYIKLGQHIAQLDNLLPDEYVHTMRKHLLDRCPASPYDEVARIIKEDLGAYPDQLFARFEREPIASASLAQVYVAFDASGRKLAVKVQHAGLRESAAADTWTVEFLVWAARMIFPVSPAVPLVLQDFDYRWLAGEVRESLPKELDFLQEAENAERCRKNFSPQRTPLGASVHVPEYLMDRTSHRVLTMEFIEGVGVTDVAALHRLGIAPAKVAQLVSKVFSEMIFVHGDVHCDPHAANMLVRKQNGRVQLVLLDHGLYRQIDDNFRYEYAGLWHALIFADSEAIMRHSAAMHAGEAYKLFTSMLTQRPWEQVVEPGLDHLTVPMTKEQREKAHAYVSEHMGSINGLLLRMPRQLLLLLKTNDCLRSVDKALGQTVNTFVITARACTRALAEKRRRQQPGLRSWLASGYDQAMVEVRIAVLRAAVLAGWLQRRLCFTRTPAMVDVPLTAA